MKTETTKKSIPVSNLTLDLYIDYVKPAAIKAGLLEEVAAHDESWGDYTALHTDAAVADDIAHCMYCSCMGQSYHDLTHEEIIRGEAENMLYQLEVTAKYDLRNTKDAVEALRAALAEMLNPSDPEIPEADLDEAVCEDVQKELDREDELRHLFDAAKEVIWDRYEHAKLEAAGIYDYHQAVLDDVIEAIWQEEPWKECNDRDELSDKLNDELWTVDSVTGNGSGSYTFSRAKAEEFLRGNAELIQEMASEFGMDDGEIGRRFMASDWEWFDVSIRCYLLSWAIQYALDLLQDGLWKEVA